MDRQLTALLSGAAAMVAPAIAFAAPAPHFDRTMGARGDARTLRLTEQIGDHLHPNDAGYTRMARTAFAVIVAKGCPR